ncbi:putative clathrin assembly protein At5g57200 [Andrographis paniculata]|uniref:putative clathrin assembly protein At5g57200 n=1 Tax=Andrographis paniculata TaxID=175694 RepID=UPI0021E8B76F|nr:putative clathrin assembly protein At5g57200 [Andrographis paniculata]
MASPVMESFRKAYGALKDSTTVGLAKVNNGQFKDLDIAIVKATNHVDSPPKERHVRKIFSAVMISCPRADVGYCIYALSRRLAKTRSWIVAVKALIVFHRMLREGDPSFKEQLIHLVSRKGNVFRISNFKDDSNSLAWDCSAWVRAYALFLEERLECLRALHFDIEADRVSKPGAPKVKCKIDMSNAQQILEHLPSLQQLLYRLLCCQPEGLACRNFLIQYAFALVVKESFKVYCSINDGIVNLVDMYFEMPKHEAIKALDIYKRAGRQADQLADFYSFCKTLDLAHTFHFPTLRQPPPSFLATMEEYIKEAPREKMQQNTNEEPETAEEPEEEVKEVETETPGAGVDSQEEIVHVSSTDAKVVDPPPSAVVHEEDDLLGLLRELSPEAKKIEESNALALAIIQPGNDLLSSSSSDNKAPLAESTGWELALVTQPSNMTRPPQVAETKMGGGFDKLLLDSLYDDEASRRQLQMQRAGGYSSGGYPQGNPFDVFAGNTADMAMVPHHHHPQQQMYMQQQQMHNDNNNNNNMMMVMTAAPYNNINNNPYGNIHQQRYYYPHQQQQQQQPMWSTNPFGDPFGYFPTNANGNHTLL